MEKYILHNDIKVLCVTATSFPTGVKAAHEKLHALLSTTTGRHFYGISYPSGPGNIIYKAAVEEAFKGEAEKLQCETFIIRKGAYMSETIMNWKKDESSIAKIFQQLLQQPNLDPDGYCVEIYLNEFDVTCMITLLN